MLFETLLEVITAIIEFVVRVIIFLFKVLGLWIPALYSLVFVIICAIFQVDFSQVLAIYLVGLTVSLILSFYIMFLRVMSRKNKRIKKKEEKRAKAKLRKNAKIKNDKKSNEEEVVKTEDKKEAAPPQQNAVAQEARENRETLEPQKYQSYCDPAQPNQLDPSPVLQSYLPPQTNSEPPQYVSPREKEDALMTSSKPLIFRTRMDPNLLIYEYSDRLVFYKKTLNGLEHVKTERKEPLK